jgi:hypothetical protein
MGKADALSRREDHSIGIEKDNTGILVIPPDRIRSVTEVRCYRPTLIFPDFSLFFLTF